MKSPQSSLIVKQNTIVCFKRQSTEIHSTMSLLYIYNWTNYILFIFKGFSCHCTRQTLSYLQQLRVKFWHPETDYRSYTYSSNFKDNHMKTTEQVLQNDDW